MEFTHEELVRAYEQMRKQRDADRGYARKAALKLGARLSVSMYPGFDDEESHISPEPAKCDLWFQLSQYDNCFAYIKALEEAGVQVEPWDGKYDHPVRGLWDLSEDPEFADSRIKQFPVVIYYYDPHASGF